jgi:hypothetical protein
MHVFYGFIIGLAFQKRPILDSRIAYLPRASIWMQMLNPYVNAFKVCASLVLCLPAWRQICS